MIGRDSSPAIEIPALAPPADRAPRVNAAIAPIDPHSETTAEVEASPRSALAVLLTNHILRDGEIVLLAIKPSLWFIVFQTLPVGLLALLIALIGGLLSPRLSSGQVILFYDAAISVLGLRLMWAVLQWLGRLYILTDRRVLRVSGALAMEVFDCPLRKIARCEMATPPYERIVRLGSIDILPSDQLCDKQTAPGAWQTISQPMEVHATIRSAIARAAGPGDKL